MTDRTIRNRRSSRLLTVLTVLIPAVLAGLAYQSMTSAARSLSSAEEDQSECRRMIADIERLRHQPHVAALYEESPSEITSRVSRAMQAAKLPASALMQVQPQAPIRVNRTQYMQRSTQVELSGVSLEQVVRFADALGDAAQGVVVRSLILTEPRSETGPTERWTAEITLTQTIFSPTIR